MSKQEEVQKLETVSEKADTSETMPVTEVSAAPQSAQNTPGVIVLDDGRRIPYRIHEVDLDAELARYEKIQKIKEKVLKKEDYLMFRGKNGEEKLAILKNGMYKLRRVCRLTTYRESIEFKAGTQDGWMVLVSVKCIDTDGVSGDGIGVATEREFDRDSITMHNRIATAETRAEVRAIAKCLALEERLADDLTKEEREGMKVVGGKKTAQPNKQSSSTSAPTQKPEKICQCVIHDVTLDPKDDKKCLTCKGVLQAPKLRAFQKHQSKQSK